MTAPKSFTLAELAQHIGAELEGDGGCLIHGLNTLQAAQSGDLSFLANPAYQRHLASTQAAAVILKPQLADQYLGNKLLIANPYKGYARLTTLFDNAPQPASGIHPSAVVHTTAQVAASASIGPNVTVAEQAVIGEQVVLDAGVVVGAHSVIGDGSHLHANVTVAHGISIGKQAILHSGCVIGADGFGFAPSAAGWIKIHQLGGVVIGDKVEIGACTTIDRGALDDTSIGNGVIIDNQVQIAHNVKIGDNTAIAGCTGIAGSTTIGSGCTIAGAACIAGHLDITDGVHISACTLVTKSITKAGSYSSGTVAAPTSQWRKSVVRFGQLDQLASRLLAVEKKLSEDTDR